MAEKYNVENKPLEQVLGFIKSGQIAIPEIQRPFVWKAVQVRDLIDSLYMGYPTGYLIISQSPDMKLKDGSTAVGKKIMIDGQQRITALMTSIVGEQVTNADFRKYRVKIAFNPLATEEDEERFKVQTPAILKDKRWIPDIAEVFKSGFSSFSFVNEYCKINEGVTPETLHNTLMRLMDIKNRQIGIIALNNDLTIDEVTEIFIRINSQGTKLNQADFAMSRMAANENYGGNMLRKAVEYFSHLAVAPEWYPEMSNDVDFMASEYAGKLEWLKDDRESIFDPDFNDILRVSFMYKFGRAKLKDLVSLLEGRDFETRENKEEISEQTFKNMSAGVLDFMSKYSFSNFVLTIKSIGFISEKLINSRMTLDFAYTLYLLLNNDPTIEKTQVKHYVARWYVMSVLTSRYISSPESAMDYDIKRIAERGFENYFQEVENADLSDNFWETQLPQRLESAAISSPFFSVFLAAQIYFGEQALFCNGTKVGDLISVVGDVHHIFPRKYLMKNGYNERNKYNQIANFTYLDPQVNKAVGDEAPCQYFTKAFCAADEGKSAFGDIKNREELLHNLEINGIPTDIVQMDYHHYEKFLNARRQAMANKIRKYYQKL